MDVSPPRSTFAQVRAASSNYFNVVTKSEPFLFDRRENLIQTAWRRVHAFEVREAQASVIVETDGHKVAVAFQQKLDGRAVFLRRENGLAQRGDAESLIVHGL